MVEAPAEGRPGFCDADAVGDQELANSTWGYSYGFFQIRSLRAHKGTGQYRDEDRLRNPDFACRSALHIFQNAGGGTFNDWTTYRTGQYKAYLQDEFPPDPGTYVVVSGDTLTKIGLKVGVEWQEIARLNNLHHPYTINIGQVLRLPDGAGLPPEPVQYTVAAGDTLWAIGKRFGIPWEHIARANGIVGPYVIHPGDVLDIPGTQGDPAPEPEPEPEPEPVEINLSNLTFNARNDDVALLQQALTDAGHDPGPVDGWYYNMTRAAIRAFEEAEGLIADGLADRAVCERLGFAVTGEDPPVPPPSSGAVSADSIRAAATGGTRISGTYSHSSMANPVSVYRKGDAVYFHAGMTIDCDGRPGSICNSTTDPWFQPQTAWQQSDGRHLDAADLPFIVIPLASSTWDYRQHGIGGGDLCVVAYRDRFLYAVVGDLGPTYRIGEASNACARALGINGDPRVGGTGSGVTYVVFPGVKVRPIESKAEASRLGAQKLTEWLGIGTSPAPSFEGEVLRLTNVERQAGGLRPLSADTRLDRAAEKHSARMSDGLGLVHSDLAAALRAEGVSFRSAAENIAVGYRTPQAVVAAWMNSPGHRDNIMSPGLTHLGVGHVQASDGQHWWTQMFASMA
ncbi:hypothetical protein BJP40_06780 [Streptomyces sp. CC53]|nr:hypothetical protein BJP40_06780 [Streptomyces sp. CC53]